MIRGILRSALSGAFFLSYGLLTLVFAPLVMLPFWPAKWIRALVRIFYRAFAACARMTCLFKIEADAECRAALANLHGAIVVMNHISLIDIVVILSLLPDSTAIAKPAVLRNPCLAPVAKKMFIVNNGDAAALVDAATKLLASGVNIVIFPQGTRGGATLYRGAARLALAARVPIQCVRLDCNPPVLGKNQPWWDVGRRTIRFSLALRRRLAPLGENSRAAARALTSEIAHEIAQSRHISSLIQHRVCENVCLM